MSEVIFHTEAVPVSYTHLDYVMNPEKTQDGRLIGAINCQVDSAFEQMKATKRKFGKVDKRQG